LKERQRRERKKKGKSKSSVEPPSVGLFWLLRIRVLNSFDDTTWNTQGDAERRDVSSDNGSGPDSASLPDRHAAENGSSDSDPAVIANGDRLGVDPELAAAREVFVMAFGDNGHIGPEPDAVTDRHNCAVLDAETIITCVS
jgi:hypothetical protein